MSNLQCGSSLLEAIFNTLLQRHENASPPSPPPPSLLFSGIFPYGGGEGNPWPLCREPPGTVETAAATLSSSSTECPVQGCQLRFEVKDLRSHIASHILQQYCGGACGLQPGPEACGFCGSVISDRSSTTCYTGLAKGSSAKTWVISSSCPQQYKMSMGPADKAGANRPQLCLTCHEEGATRPYVWSYHYLDHLQLCHPTQVVPEEEVGRHAITLAKYEAVIRKDLGQKAGVAARVIDAWKAEVEGASTTSLFWSRFTLHEEAD